MKRLLPAACIILLMIGVGRAADPFKFRAQEIDKSLKVGYCVITADINGDGKLDIVVADADRVVWFENPTWKLHTIVRGQTKLDYVSISAADIDGDGKLDIALGAGWKPGNTREPSTLQWFSRGPNIDEPWAMHMIDYDQPLLHRIRFADLGDGKPSLLVGPLQGPGSSAAKNWMETPLKFVAYSIPKNPLKADWTPIVLDESKHVMHNFFVTDLDGDKQPDILTASYEGVNLLKKSADGKWTSTQLGEGFQANPSASRGSSEIKLGRLKGGKPFIVTIEPFHGNQLVVYTEPAEAGKLWTRHVIDDELKWGHALGVADLDGDGSQDIIMGYRDPVTGTLKYGLRLYKAADPAGKEWEKQVLEHGTVAVEDLTVADLDGDGRPDIIAVGRATGNVKIFWNETGK